MNDKRNYRVCVGGIILLVVAVLGFITSLISGIGYLISCIQSFAGEGIAMGLPSIISTLISSVPLLIFAVLLVMKHHGKGLTVVSLISTVLYFLFNIIMAVTSIIAYAETMPELVLSPVLRIVMILGYTLFLLSVVLLCAKATGKNPASARKLGMMPGVVFVVYSLLSAANTVAQYLITAQGATMSAMVPVMVGSVIGLLIGSAVNAVCWFLIGGWIANPYIKGFQPQQPEQEMFIPQGWQQPAQGSNPQQNYQSPYQPPYNGGYGR